MSQSDLFKEASELVDAIDKKHNWQHDTDTVFMHLVEEFGEVARQLYNQKNNREKFDIENMRDELADVFILLCKLADNHNIDLEEAVKKKMDKNKKRFGV